MKKFIILLFIFNINILFTSETKIHSINISGGGWTGNFTIYGTYKKNITDSDIINGKGVINVFLPSNYNLNSTPYPLVIALPGWRLKADEWRSKAQIDNFAERLGYVVVLAEMETSAYETSFFKETQENFKWGNIPGTLWIGEIVIPFIRKAFNVDNSGNKTAIIGLSTGGRGAVYIAQRYPKIRVSVSMSGDFDRISLLEWTKKTKRNIMHHDPPSITIYGNPYNNKSIFKRWELVDNPSSDENIRALKRNNTSILLIHGKKDFVVPFEQSFNFYKKLKDYNIDSKIIEVEEGGHDWQLWSSYLHASLQFIKKKFDKN